MSMFLHGQEGRIVIPTPSRASTAQARISLNTPTRSVGTPLTVAKGAHVTVQPTKRSTPVLVARRAHPLSQCLSRSRTINITTTIIMNIIGLVLINFIDT